MHASFDEVEGSADGDDDGHEVPGRAVVVSEVQVPARAAMVGEPGIGDVRGEQVVESGGPLSLLGRIRDRQPVVDERPDLGELARRCRSREFEIRVIEQAGQLAQRLGRIVGESHCEPHGLLTVMV